MTVVEFAERKILDELSITEITDQLSELIQRHSGIRLLLSFRNVEHLSSAALGMLITINKKVNDTGGQLKLASIVPQIYELFKMTRLDGYFDIHDTDEAAVAAFK